MTTEHPHGPAGRGSPTSGILDRVNHVKRDENMPPVTTTDLLGRMVMPKNKRSPGRVCAVCYENGTFMLLLVGSRDGQLYVVPANDCRMLPASDQAVQQSAPVIS